MLRQARTAASVTPRCRTGGRFERPEWAGFALHRPWRRRLALVATCASSTLLPSAVKGRHSRHPASYAANHQFVYALLPLSSAQMPHLFYLLRAAGCCGSAVASAQPDLCSALTEKRYDLFAVVRFGTGSPALPTISRQRCRSLHARVGCGVFHGAPDRACGGRPGRTTGPS